MPRTDAIWNPEYECLSRAKLEELKSAKLQEQVKHVYKHSAYFRSLYDDNDVKPRDVRDLDDLRQLPTAEKDDLRSFREQTGDLWCGALCVPDHQLKATSHSTGTTGKPNFYGLTPEDYDRVGELFARVFYSWGLRQGDVINVFGELSWHGWSLASRPAIRKIGAVPIQSASNPQNIAESLFELQPEADFDAVYGLFQAETERQYIEENDIDPQAVFPNVRFVCSTVDLSEPKRELWEELWGVPFRNSYGSGDQFWSFVECDHDDRYYHVPEDMLHVEVLDPSSGEPVEPGEYGELYVTNLWAEASPYIRYRMEDLVDFKRDRCSCGRTSMRVRPLGRLSWSVSVAGRDRPVTSVEVEEVLWSYEALFAENYQLVQVDPAEQDELIVRVATEATVDEETIRAVEADLGSTFGVPSRFSVVSPGEIGLESAIKMERVAEEF